MTYFANITIISREVEPSLTTFGDPIDFTLLLHDFNLSAHDTLERIFCTRAAIICRLTAFLLCLPSKITARFAIHKVRHASHELHERFLRPTKRVDEIW